MDYETTPNGNQHVDAADTATSFSKEGLLGVRRRLLDLTARNQLLNYKHPATRSLRVVNNLPGRIASELFAGNSLSLSYVPQPTDDELLENGYAEIDPETGKIRVFDKSVPTAKAWAKHLGIPTQYELEPINALEDPRAPQNSSLQTLFYASSLDAKARKIANYTNTSMEESGSHILYIVLGFLEWYESDQSEVARLAPLIVLPVELNQMSSGSGGGLKQYAIQSSEDGLLENVSLRQRLNNDFSFELPVRKEDESAEEYFTLVESRAKAINPRWRIRRFASLCLLDFTKQAMYQDLDPARWPENAPISDHKLISRIFSEAEGEDVDGGSVARYSELDLDNIPDLHQQYPLIYEADSSQHSAIIDALNGKNLVIEGPPGTGKSQTITNLIAASMASGKRVLFMAEKMEALRVVSKRLDSAGLGSLCLELHSHKVKKTTVLESLMEANRARESVENPNELNKNIARYEAIKQRLSTYAEKIGSNWEDTEQTIHHILNSAARYREEVNLDYSDLEQCIESMNLSDLTAVRFDELFDDAKTIQGVYGQVAKQSPNGDIEHHYWYGVVDKDLSTTESTRLMETLRAWTDSLEQLWGLWIHHVDEFGLRDDKASTTDGIAKLVDSYKNLPDVNSDLLLKNVTQHLARVDEFEDLLQIRKDARDKAAYLENYLKPSAIADAGAAIRFRQANIALVVDLGVVGSTQLERILRDPDNIELLQDKLRGIEVHFESLRTKLNPEFHSILNVDNSSIAGYLQLHKIVDELPEHLWNSRDEIFDAPGLPEHLNSVSSQIKSLKQQESTLAKTFDIDSVNGCQRLISINKQLNAGGVFGFLSKEWRQAKRSLLLLAVGARPAWKKLHTLLPDLIRFQKDIEALDCFHKENPILGKYFDGIDTDLDKLGKLVEWNKLVRDTYGRGNQENAKLAQVLLTGPADDMSQLNTASKAGFSREASSVQQELKILSVVYSRAFTDHSKDECLLNPNGVLVKLNKQLKVSFSTILDFTAVLPLNITELSEIADNWHVYGSNQKSWQECSLAQETIPQLFSLSIDSSVDDEQAVTALYDYVKLLRLAEQSPGLGQAIAQRPETSTLLRLKQSASALEDVVRNETGHRDTFAALPAVDITSWQRASRRAVYPQLERNLQSLEKQEWMGSWQDYLRTCDRMGKKGLKPFIDLLIKGEVEVDQVELYMNYVIYKKLSDNILESDELLKEFTGHEQTELRKQFVEYDKKIQLAQRKSIFWKCCQQDVPVGIAGGRASSYTEYSLIKREYEKKSKHIPIRTLLRRAAGAINTLKPCFMMSPMSVAQYLEPGMQDFDLVIIDEASQIRPAEALGAIARGKTLVVVGDSKQLPPTSFFEKSTVDEEDEDTAVVENSESILDTLSPMFSQRRLRWHYRSRHESLIAFSNNHFYDSDLICFPSPIKESEEFGITFQYVPSGTFVGRKNIYEAEEVVNAFEAHLRNRSDESVGIVTMNISQCEQVEAIIESRCVKDPLFKNLVENNCKQQDRYFVKNLERVQGDERDVIIISMTYGPLTPGGQVPQRFGPINRDTGWRRLNVLFTRSRKRMIVVSSFDANNVSDKEGASKGVKALRAFLKYAKDQVLDGEEITGREPDSPFEISVANRLKREGYLCEPQLGVAGYRLDIAVSAEDAPGHYLMAIECDGATYHSSISARDRDRLRQDVLEGLGWQVRRIWSVDWFKNPEPTIRSILYELDKMREENAAKRKAVARIESEARKNSEDPDGYLTRPDDESEIDRNESSFYEESEVDGLQIDSSDDVLPIVQETYIGFGLESVDTDNLNDAANEDIADDDLDQIHDRRKKRHGS